jgi:two-component system, NarL family, sensor histidine kinase DegS
MAFKTGEMERNTEQLRESISEKISQAQKRLEGVTTKIQQSQVEVDKLAQRQIANSANIRNIKENTNEFSAVDVRNAYDEALEAQQRLFVMRGQMDKLNSEQVHLQELIMQLQDTKGYLTKTPLLEGGDSELNAAEFVESVIQAQELERKRLSNRMHDGPAQALSNFILQVEIAQRLFDIDTDQARDELDELKANASSTFTKVRDFIFELRPMMLDDLGLTPTLRHYFDAFKEQNEIEVHFTASGTERRLESYLEIMIFRAVQELVSNAARHSQASTIRTHIDTNEERVVVDVEDDGQGFNEEQAMETSMGIKVIKERVDILNGEFNIDTAIGQGTRIGFTIPIATEGQDVFA